MHRSRYIQAALLALLVIGVVVGGPRLWRVLPLLTLDNSGAEKVVLVHGLGRTERAMLLLEGSLTEAGFDVYSLHHDSREDAPEALLAAVARQIDACCSGGSGAVHYVGHSLGGLLIRDYLSGGTPANLGRVVLLGSPNSGSELADAERHGHLTSAWLARAGPAARLLNTGPDGYPARLPPPDYPVGVIAGTRDNALSNAWLPVPNDGLVSVASARLEGMTDFVSYPVAHWDLRNDAEVASQVIAFLERGAFDPPGP